MLPIKAAIIWLFTQYVNLYHGFVNLLRLWFPDNVYLWNNLTWLEEYVASNALLFIALSLVVVFLFWRNRLLSKNTVNKTPIKISSFTRLFTPLYNLYKASLRWARAILRRFL